MQVIMNRSKPLEEEPFWIVRLADEKSRRSSMVYMGNKARDAVEAAVKAGLPKEEAMAQYEAIMKRVRAEDVDDTV